MLSRVPEGARSLWARHGDRLWRYLLVGATGTLVNFAVLKAVWPVLHGTPSLADGVASEVAILTNYGLNTWFTFRSRPSWRTLLQYNLVLAGGSLLQVGVFTLLVDLGLYYLLANLLAIPFNTIVGFVLSQWWVFRPEPAGKGVPVPAVRRSSSRGDRGGREGRDDDDERPDPEPLVGSADRRR
ncbi:MAG: GtrA family protein [Thermaerobacter sp.]|nr:GtrA family protein [Thermaerobacter sp.]